MENTIQEYQDRRFENVEGYDFSFKEPGQEDEVFYDDGTVHVRRNGLRHCFAVPECVSEKKMLTLEKKYAKIVDAILEKAA